MASNLAESAKRSKRSNDDLSTTTPLKRIKLMDSTVTIIALPSLHKFQMHKGLLCSVSTYFKAAIEGSFKEGEKKVLRLEDTRVWVLERFQLWLYHERILDVGETHTGNDFGSRDLVDLYVFGDVRGIPKLQNTVMDALISRMTFRKAAALNTTAYIYSVTPEGSPLRRMHVESFCHIAHGFSWSKWFGEKARPKNISADCMWDIIQGFLAIKLQKTPFPFNPMIDRCKFHIHAQGEPQCVGQPSL